MAGEDDEQVDLDEKRRKYILDAHAQLNRLNHYQLLGVARQADKKAIKAAYYRLAGLVHPDRYFGKKLGSYKPKMEAVFAAIASAYETLSSPDRRAAYDAQLERYLAQAPPEEAPVRAPVDPRLVAKRQAALDALKQHHAAGRAKASEYAAQGTRARAAGDVVGAAEAYKRALTFDPNNAAIQEAYEETQRAAGEKLAEAHMRKALLEEKFGRWAAAAESWQRVMAAKPNDPEVHARLANALARAGSVRSGGGT
jgi:curved DNA-binding protein CbpA